MERWEIRGQRNNRRAEAALNDYLKLGSGRSLAALLKHYRADKTARTKNPQTLQEWSERYDWQKRAECYDQQQLANARRAETEHQNQVLSTGLALSFGRVENLKQLYEQLDGYLRQAWPVWLADLRNASGEPASPELSRAPRFSTSVIIQMRGILEDLARETGGRLTRSPASAQPAHDPHENKFPDLRALSPDQLDAIDRILQEGSPGPAWQPGLPD